MGVSENSGTPKSSILVGFSIINHPFWGTPIFGNSHIDDCSWQFVTFSYKRLSWACETDPEEPSVEWRDEEVHVNDMRALRTIRHDQKTVKIRHQDFEETCFLILVRESHVKQISKYSILQRSWYCLLNSKHVSQVFAVNLRLCLGFSMGTWCTQNQGPGEQHLAGVGHLGFCNASDLAADLLVEYQGQWRGTMWNPQDFLVKKLQRKHVTTTFGGAPTKGSLGRELWTKLAERFRNLQVDNMSQFTQKDASQAELHTKMRTHLCNFRLF